MVFRNDVLPANCTLPLFATLNLVTPAALAVIRSPELPLLTMNEALLPIPPLTESGAGVFAAEPMETPVLKSLERIVPPEPFGGSVRLLLLPDGGLVGTTR